MPVPNAPGLVLTALLCVAAAVLLIAGLLAVAACLAGREDRDGVAGGRTPIGPQTAPESPREGIARLAAHGRPTRPTRPTQATAAYAASVRSAALYARVRPLDPRTARGSVTPN